MYWTSSTPSVGGPAGEFLANIFESAKIWEKSLERKNKKTSGPQTDGRTNFIDNLLSPLLPPPLVKQLHSLHKGIGILSRRYGITHAGGDAVVSTKSAYILPPSRSWMPKHHTDQNVVRLHDVNHSFTIVSFPPTHKANNKNVRAGHKQRGMADGGIGGGRWRRLLDSLTRCQSWSITINCFFWVLLLLVTIKLI
jgi:hypothetical protein